MSMGSIGALRTVRFFLMTVPWKIHDIKYSSKICNMRTEPQTDCEIWVITVNHEASLQYMCRWMGNAGQGKIINARGGRSTLHIFYEHGVLLEISPLKTKDMLSQTNIL